jgi:hypothetical protein
LIPALFVMASVVTLLVAPWGDWSAGLVLLILLGTMMVGFAEEIVFRSYLLSIVPHVNGAAAMVLGVAPVSSPRPAPMDVKKSQSPWMSMATTRSPLTRRTR